MDMYKLGKQDTSDKCLVDRTGHWGHGTMGDSVLPIKLWQNRVATEDQVFS